MGLKNFRRDNRLSQQDLADYLGVGRSFISQVETGVVPFPKDRRDAIIANPDWDTSSLMDDDGMFVSVDANDSVTVIGNGNDTNVRVRKKKSDVSPELTLLRQEVEMLRVQLAEEKERSEKYWQMIQQLMSYGKQ